MATLYTSPRAEMLHKLYLEALAADDAWHQALIDTYGQRQALEARYEMTGPKGGPRRGTATPTLAALYATFRATSDAYWIAARTTD